MAKNLERKSKAVPPASISIRGARQNNLKGVDVEIPRGALVAITGVSGSGKSSLAFDTLFREGQRRFLETLSAYARQFLGRMEKPEVDSVEGLSPAIAVDQRAMQRGPRSTVGTLTEIFDHLRVLFARAGTATCPEHGQALTAQTPAEVLTQVLGAFEDQKVLVLAPLVRDRKGAHKALFADLQRKGYVRVRVDGEVLRIEEVPELERYKRHKIELVVDRLRVGDGVEARLREALGTAIEVAGGDVMLSGESDERTYSTLRACATCGLEAPPLEPRLFSFNSPHGACSTCDGLGQLREPTRERVVSDSSLSIRDGALAVTRASGGALLFPKVDFEFLAKVGESADFDLDTPWKEISEAGRRAVMEGTGEARFTDRASWNGSRFSGKASFERRYRGVLPALRKAWKGGGRRKLVERLLEVAECSECNGVRLNPVARSTVIAGTRIADLLNTPVEQLSKRLNDWKLPKREAAIARDLLREIERRLGFLLEVGLGYLSLDRGADTLSSGESQRIRLAAQLGAGLQGVLYVLDEPSIGLHARDHSKLLGALRKLCAAGNTVVVVEHDEATLRAADLLIDVGPGAGRNGGRIVASGTPADVALADSPTGALMRGDLNLPVPDERRPGNGKFLRLKGAHGFNLRHVDCEIPLGTFTAVSGVSGSGKTTLIRETLLRALLRKLGRDVPSALPHVSLEGAEHLDDVVSIDSSPIGRTPRSNPATYTGAFSPIRDLFSSLTDARMRGWGPGRFSFNVEGGRCESCQGAGAQYVELQFLAPVTVSCSDCGGHRFQPETLEVRFRGVNIADVLALTIDDAAEFFADHPRILRPLKSLQVVGLGYLTLGQPSTTLSGGEAQRVKLAKHLQLRSRKEALFLLDEPTTGLHQADVQKLVGALQQLVDQGHTVLVIEHNLDLLACADHLIDIGPEAGAEGGEVLVAGTPADVEAEPRSATGRALKDHNRARKKKLKVGKAPKGIEPPDCLSVFGARTHNLRKVNVEIPRNAFTVITGPSGSGKSSLALDTIHAAGKQRFVESLSTYARQFLQSRDKPPVDRIEGLGPSISVEASVSASSHPRSTVATTTEIHDHMRVLWSRAGIRRCPDHGEKLERSDAGRLAKRILRDHEGQSAWLLAPIFDASKGAEFDAGGYLEARESWRSQGYARVFVDSEELRLEELPDALDPDARVDLVIDRLRIEPDTRSRIAEAIEAAEQASGGRVSVQLRGKSRGSLGERVEYGTQGACTQCGFRIEEELEPRHFSFNAHVGACPGCDGLGSSWQCDPDLLVDHPECPLVAGQAGDSTAVGGKLGRYLTKGKGYYEHLLRAVAKSHRIDLSKPFAKLSERQRDLILFGKGARDSYRVKIEKHSERMDLEEEFSADWPGLCGHVEAWHVKADDPGWRQVLETFMTRQTCRACNGERLADGPRSCTVGRKRLPEVLALSVEESLAWLSSLKLAKARAQAVQPVLAELTSRLSLLERVGLGYLTLDRGISTLSGGEARRVRLSANLGSQLVGVCYVLDEPTVGLHPADIDRLTEALHGLRDLGNTVIAVEHDESLMERADYIVDMGPGAGRRGGKVVVAGTPQEVRAHAKSLTGMALRGELTLDAAEGPSPAQGLRRELVGIRGARLHNLRNVSMEAAFGEITGVCGPSGSGKSTLVLDCLVPALGGERSAGRWASISGALGGRRRLVVVDASPIGRTPASIPATAVNLMDPLRELFTRTPEARMRGYTKSYFSFNSTKGRCPACEGRGAERIEMQFLADLWLTCEECDGQRYRPEVLEIRYRGKNMADILSLSAEEALEFLAAQPMAAKILETLVDVGLGYLQLGQSSTTLSSGEAQRVKLATELLRSKTAERSITVLDEPTTGLHASDVQHLARVLRRLASRGDCVIVIEHHTGLLSVCDRLVELGPAGGVGGGRILTQGTPAELMQDPASLTGPYLGSRRAPHKQASSKRTSPTGGKPKPRKKAAKKAGKQSKAKRAGSIEGEVSV